MSKASNDLFRPKTLSDIIGQDITTSIIAKQISTKTLASTYIFVGAAGTGKTSLARVMAHELGCEPVEINAAVYNSVNDVRELNKDASYHKIGQEYNFYIIDECHQYLKAGYSALLKLLEEPKENTIFVLCTTELQRIPKTILSRAQVFYFKPVKSEEIAQRLGIICEDQGVAFEPEALEFIAKSAFGCVRDAVQKLDQVSSLGKITLDSAKSVIPDYDILQRVLVNKEYDKLDELECSSVSVDALIQEAVNLALSNKIKKSTAVGLVKLRPFLNVWEPMKVIRCYLEGTEK